MPTCGDGNFFFPRHPGGKESLLVSTPMNASESLWILLMSSTCFVALDVIQYQPSFYTA